MIVETSSIISLLTNTDPNKACSASKFEGCLLSIFFCEGPESWPLALKSLSTNSIKAFGALSPYL